MVIAHTAAAGILYLAAMERISMSGMAGATRPVPCLSDIRIGPGITIDTDACLRPCTGLARQMLLGIAGPGLRQAPPGQSISSPATYLWDCATDRKPGPCKGTILFLRGLTR